MEAWIITAVILNAWLISSRSLFRYWYKNDILKNEDRYGKKIPMSRGEVATIAMLASLLFPIVLAVTFVLYKPPLKRTEIESRTRQLTAENERLRREYEEG